MSISQYDENGELHSYDDQPVLVDDVQNWYWHGRLHRNNDLPAQIEKDRKLWYTMGVQHRIGGPYLLYSNGYGQYSLYNVKLTPDVYWDVINNAHEMGYPIWLSLFAHYDLVDYSQIEEFRNKNTGKWDYGLPIGWLLKVWGVDEAAFVHQVYNLIDERDEQSFLSQLRYEGSLPLEAACRVINYERNLVTQ